MNQRIHNLSKWRLFPEGDAWLFTGGPRVVILEVNCPGEVFFYAIERSEEVEAGAVTFVGVAKGRDRLEFAVDGDFELSAEGGDAYIYSFDGQDIVTRVTAPEIFTRLANRKQRNANLEMIEFRMKENQRRFMAQLAEEQEIRLENIRHELASYLPDRNEVAPSHLVGKASGQDGLEVGAAAEELAVDEPPAKPARRKKAGDVEE